MYLYIIEKSCGLVVKIALSLENKGFFKNSCGQVAVMLWSTHPL